MSKKRKPSRLRRRLVAAASVLLVAIMALSYGGGTLGSAAGAIPVVGAPLQNAIDPVKPLSTPTVPAPSLKGWDSPAQLANAKIIVDTGREMRLPKRAYVIAIATAMQESTLHNEANDNPKYPLAAAHSQALPHEGVGHDHDSVGLFQQRPKPPEGDGGWGPVKELMNPHIAASKFYGSLKHVKNWEHLSLTQAAQAVQRSGFPNAYAKHEATATAIVNYLCGTQC